MKEAFADIKQVFPTISPACDQALMTAVHSVSEDKPVIMPRPARRMLVLTAALLAITCLASAAFYPQIVTWFAAHHGESFSAWMEKDSAAASISAAGIENNGAVFTIDEVLVKGRGLYVLGTIKAADGYTLVEYDSSAQDPFGYDIHYGETAPAGTPTIAEKAKETRGKLRYVICHLEKIGVDGGAMLTPGCWGYGANVQRDGSIVFTMEIEDGFVVEPGTTYTLEFSAQTYAAHDDATLNPDDASTKTWQITVAPKPFEQQ